MDPKPKLVKTSSRRQVINAPTVKLHSGERSSEKIPEKSILRAGGVTDKSTSGRYSDADVHNHTVADGYVAVHPALWDHIPGGAHIRYIKKDDGNGLPRNERFKPGGFVKNHYTNKDGKKMFMLETIPGGQQKNEGGRNYISFPVAYENIDELWKKYDRFAFVEIHLMYNSLAVKKQQIESLEAKNMELDQRLTLLENILRNAIKK